MKLIDSSKNNHKLFGEIKLNNRSKTPREILEKNVLKGKLAEEIAKQDYVEHGFKIHQTGIGSDFIAEKKLGNSIYQIYVDVKSGKSKLTKKQKQTKSKLKKQNIPFDEYRVTDEYLEFQIENNPKFYKFGRTLDLDISKFTGMFAIQDPTDCPNCGLIANGLDDITVNFGLRNMDDGSVRVQSWCRNCRNYSGRGRK
jgi:hypothetical protein